MSLLCSSSESPPNTKSSTINKLDFPIEFVALSSPRTTLSPDENRITPCRNLLERNSASMHHRRCPKIHIQLPQDVQYIQNQQKLISAFEPMSPPFRARTCGDVFDAFLLHETARVGRGDLAPITLSAHRQIL